MSSVGPSLPAAHANKRKCGDEGGSDTGDEDSSHSSPSSKIGSVSSFLPNKRPRIIGPTLPPASLDERPSQPLDSDADSSSCDDEFGPILPADMPQKQRISPDQPLTSSALTSSATATAKSQRDEWMVVPPSSGDWAARVDPTKLKNRKFNTGNSSKGPARTSGQGNSVNWTETPDEKRARLQREMMGITDISSVKDVPQDKAQARDNARRLREYNEKSRGPTLYKEHQNTNPREKEDDASARPFDREKDIAGGLKINHTQRREFIAKATDFGSRFSSGKFL